MEDREVLAVVQEIVAAHNANLVVELFPPEIMSVGVQGDEKTYTRVINLRGRNPGWEVLGKISSAISADTRIEINRVTFEPIS